MSMQTNIGLWLICGILCLCSEAQIEERAEILQALNLYTYSEAPITRPDQ